MTIGSLIREGAPTELWILGYFLRAMYLLVGVSTRLVSRLLTSFRAKTLGIYREVFLDPVTKSDPVEF